MSDEHDYREEDKAAQEEFIDKPARRAKLIAVALFSLKYDLEDGNENIIDMVEVEGITVTDDIINEVEELFEEFKEAIT